MSATDESPYPIEEHRVVLIGGGLGSFALASRLRVGGVATEDICVISPDALPEESFVRACRASGMRDDDLLRSDSSARIDNLWGFPGYAATEARRQRRIRPLLRVLGEPVLAETYAPTLATVEAGVRREAERIGWADMLLQGVAQQITTRPGGGFLVTVRTPTGPRTIGCDDLHLALGAADPHIDTETRDFNDPTGILDRTVNARAPHEHVYADLAQRGGTVLVRGSGIDSSRVLQRLIDDRDRSGRRVKILQQFEDYRDGADGRRGSQPDAAWGFIHQRDDHPKAAYGGQLQDELAALPEDERHARIAELGFPSTPYRKEWASPLRRGRAEGWYQALAGDITGFSPQQGGVRVHFKLADGSSHQASFSYVIDCTEAETDASRHPLVRDLQAQGLASLNPLGGLRVDDEYAIVGAASGEGRIFASGAIAAGAATPVDTFFGLQSAALTIADHLADRGVGTRLSPWRSTAAWWRWMRGEAA